VLLAGFSIGSGVAARLARERRVDGVLLVTPFDSLEALAAERYPWMPVRLLLRHRFRSDLHLAGLDVPTAVIAASDDRVVPRARTEALLRVLARPVLAETVPGSTHGGIYGLPAMDAALRRAVDALLAAAASAGAAGTLPQGAAGRVPGGL
jgi:pimeloyl-ACP methyl ester carboxylesterase